MSVAPAMMRVESARAVAGQSVARATPECGTPELATGARLEKSNPTATGNRRRPCRRRMPDPAGQCRHTAAAAGRPDLRVIPGHDHGRAHAGLPKWCSASCRRRAWEQARAAVPAPSRPWCATRFALQFKTLDSGTMAIGISTSIPEAVQTDLTARGAVTSVRCSRPSGRRSRWRRTRGRSARCRTSARTIHRGWS